jgi:hypothetical protein
MWFESRPVHSILFGFIFLLISTIAPQTLQICTFLTLQGCSAPKLHRVESKVAPNIYRSIKVKFHLSIDMFKVHYYSLSMRNKDYDLHDEINYAYLLYMWVSSSNSFHKLQQPNFLFLIAIFRLHFPLSCPHYRLGNSYEFDGCVPPGVGL